MSNNCVRHVVTLTVLNVYCMLSICFRLYAVQTALERGYSVDHIHALSKIDKVVTIDYKFLNSILYLLTYIYIRICSGSFTNLEILLC